MNKVFIVRLTKKEIHNIYFEEDIEKIKNGNDFTYTQLETTNASKTFLFSTLEQAKSFLDNQNYLRKSAGIWIDKRFDITDVDSKIIGGMWEAIILEKEIRDE